MFECPASEGLRRSHEALFLNVQMGDLRGFIMQDPHDVARFISECLVMFESAEQPTQAEGLNNL